MSAWNLQEAVVPVTGAASGIGFAICQHLRAAGATPLLLDANGARLKTAAQELYGEAGARHAWTLDVRDARAVDACLDAIRSACGPVTHGVAAAGIVGPAHILTLDDAEWHRVIDVNLHGAMYFCRAVARQLAGAKRGAIVAIGSIASFQAKENRLSYTASKAAVVNLVRAMALDLGALGIRVNAVAPGVIDTPIQDRNRATLPAVSETIPLKRVGMPDDIANAVLFLLSDLAGYITGETIVVDGGMTAKYR